MNSSLIDKSLLNRLLNKYKPQPDTLLSNNYNRLFEKALAGKLEPKINVIPADPGSGKSRGIQTFLMDYKAKGFKPNDNGVVIFLSRRSEIKDYINGAGLLRNDYAVLDSQPLHKRLIEYGGLRDANDAPILFTTSQLLISRCGSSFETFDELFYRGKPRALRIWDEGFKIADAVSVSGDELGGWKGVVRSSHPKLAVLLDDLEASLHGCEPGDQMPVPHELGMLAQGAARTLEVGVTGGLDAARRLVALSGSMARVSTATHKVKALVSASNRLPDDIAPLFVFDASARVDNTYAIMEAAGVPIVKKDVPPVSYANATFHHMVKGAGRATLRTDGIRASVLFEAAEVMNLDPTEPWIVVYHDLTGIDLRAEIKAKCKNPDRLEFVRWGDHRASNDLRHISKVMVIGLLRYPEVGYDQIHLACDGSLMNRTVELPIARESEIRSVMLQAFARSNIRNHTLSVCGKCSVYVIDSAKYLHKLISETFPDAKVENWKQIQIRLTKSEQDLLNHIKAIPIGNLLKGVKKSKIYGVMKMDRSNFSKLVNSNNIRVSLAKERIRVDRNKIFMDV